MRQQIGLSESGAEKVPTLEEIRSILREVIGKEYQEGRVCADEKGVYLFEATAPGEPAGETNEYLYTREGEYPECSSLATEIHVIYYDKDGVPYNGTSVARWVDGQWKIL